MRSMMDIKLDRIRAGIKAIDMAKKIGISCGQLSKIEHGHIPCPPELQNQMEKYIDTCRLF